MPATKPASALVLAALAATLLASAAATMLVDTRRARASASESLRLERARMQARTLAAEALVQLDAGAGLPQQGELFAADNGARVLRQDAAGLIDINTASPELVAALLGGLGLSAEDAEALADRIADWRDDDHLTRTHGAEREAYVRADLAPPENRPFVVESEVARVLGVTPHLAACLSPWITTYSAAGDVDPQSAPPFLRETLARPATAIPEQAPPFGRAIRLTAEAPISDTAVVQMIIWARLTGDQRAPFIIHRAAESFARRGASENPAACMGAPA